MEDHTAQATVGETEIRALEAHLLVTGPMKRSRLAQAMGADQWSDGTFDEAVRQAIEQGKIRELLLDWLQVARW